MPLLAAVLGVFGLVILPLNNGFSRLVEQPGRWLRARIDRQGGRLHQRDDTAGEPESRRADASRLGRVLPLQPSLHRQAPRLRRPLGTETPVAIACSGLCYCLTRTRLGSMMTRRFSRVWPVSVESCRRISCLRGSGRFNVRGLDDDDPRMRRCVDTDVTEVFVACKDGQLL